MNRTYISFHWFDGHGEEYGGGGAVGLNVDTLSLYGLKFSVVAVVAARVTVCSILSLCSMYMKKSTNTARNTITSETISLLKLLHIATTSIMRMWVLFLIGGGMFLMAVALATTFVKSRQEVHQISKLVSESSPSTPIPAFAGTDKVKMNYDYYYLMQV